MISLPAEKYSIAYDDVAIVGYFEEELLEHVGVLVLC